MNCTTVSSSICFQFCWERQCKLSIGEPQYSTHWTFAKERWVLQVQKIFKHSHKQKNILFGCYMHRETTGRKLTPKDFSGLPQKMKNKIPWLFPDHSTKLHDHFKIVFGLTFNKQCRRPQNIKQCLPLIDHRQQKITKQIKLQIVQTRAFIQWIHCTHTPQ